MNCRIPGPLHIVFPVHTTASMTEEEQPRDGKDTEPGGQDRRPEVLVDRYLGDVYSACFRHLGHREDAGDAAQQTFAEALKNPDRLANVHSLQAWLLTLARNVAFSLLRSRRRTARMS